MRLNERKNRLKSRTLLYETSKTLQYMRYLNFAKSQISAEISDCLVDQPSVDLTFGYNPFMNRQTDKQVNNRVLIIQIDLVACTLIY